MTLAPGLRAPFAAAGAVLAATALVGSVDPHEPGHYPTCPMLALTGWNCPLCGGLRAVNDVVHGRVQGALGSNVVVVLGAVVVLLMWSRWTLARARGRDRPFADPSPLTTALVLGGLALFGILRNLPIGAALAA